MHDVVLKGCRPEPLASYLKALGVLRLVAEQKDKNAQGFWQGEHFVLRSMLDEEALMRFFREEWSPTPLVAPWNGRSGFTMDEEDEDPDVGEPSTSGESPLNWIRDSTYPRLARFRSVVESILAWPDLPPTDLRVSELLAETRERLKGREFAESTKGKEWASLAHALAQAPNQEAFSADMKVEAGEREALSKLEKKSASKLLTQVRGWKRSNAKQTYVERCRSTLPDEVVSWLDTVLIAASGADGPSFAALLGSGANDGSLDFAKNFFARLKDALAAPQGVLVALFDTAARQESIGTTGFFSPVQSDSDARTNPWDVVLCMEGTLLFSGAATRRFESGERGGVAFPFQARPALTTNSSAREGGRDEVWLPLWQAPASAREVRKLFAEGRVRVGARSAENAVDFARSVSSLGVDRGLSGFVRISMIARNGKNHFATAQGHWPVRALEHVRLLDELDEWMSRFRRSTSGTKVPARVGLVARELEEAVLAGVERERFTGVLMALAGAEESLGLSLSFAKKSSLRPLPTLSSGWWDVVPTTAEARLGVCLGRRQEMRRRVSPLDPKKLWDWGRYDDAGFVFRQRPLVENLHALLLRDDIEAQQGLTRAFDATNPCRLEDIVAFIDGQVDDELVERWARAATLLPPGSASAGQDVTLGDVILPPAAFSVLALVQRGVLMDGTVVKRTQTMLSRACAGDSVSATTAALQRLNAVGRALPVRALQESVERTRRIAAALAFPLSREQRWRLESAVLPKATSQSDEVSI
jgi:CRISPR-associated protein Csx17